MKICFPANADNGLQSQIFGHFGSAPCFLMIDSDTNECRPIDNGDKIHEHGACRPLAALGGEPVDAIVVGGIGRGAYMGLTNAGIKVYQAIAPTVEGCLAALKDGSLTPITPDQLCGGHGGGCSGHH